MKKYLGVLFIVILPLLFVCVYVANMEKSMMDEQAEVFFNKMDSVFNLQAGQGDTTGIYSDSIGIIIDL